MAIFKAKIETNYTVIPNSTAQDKNLSFEARGMLALLLSLPDDWSINKEWLIKQSKAGRDKVQNTINELVEFGYMSKTQPKNQKGQFTSNDFFVYPTPVNGFSVNGLPVNGKTPTTKETVIQKKQDTNLMAQSEIKPSKKNAYPDEFEWLWANKPDREGGNPKKQAYSACKARLKEGVTWREMAEGLNRYFKYCKATGILNTRMVQQMSTFFGTKESFKEQWSVNHAANKQGHAQQSRYDQSQSKLAEWAKQNGVDGMAMGVDDSNLRPEMDQGLRGSADIDLDSGDWETI